MSATVLYMSMSLDGFIAGPNERLETPSATADAATRLRLMTQIGSPWWPPPQHHR